MIALDTNVLVRLFLRDDPKQTEEAELFVEEALQTTLLYIPAFVLPELVWVLGRKGFNRSKITGVLEALTEMPGYVIGHRQAVTQALAWYKSGKADFADYLIHADGITVGAKELVTFDETFAKEDKKRRKRPRAWRK